MKAYKIDAYKNIVETLEVTNDYREITRAIGCDLFCIGKTLDNGDTVYVDDNGFLDPRVTRGFMFDGQFFAGNGFVLGTDRSGESKNVKMKELDIASRVMFAPERFQITDKVREAAMNSWKITSF